MPSDPGTCLLCKRHRPARDLPVCERCSESTSLHRVVTVSQLAALSPGLTEDKIWWYLKRRKENGLTASGAVYTPYGTRSVFLHLDRFERWLSGVDDPVKRKVW